MIITVVAVLAAALIWEYFLRDSFLHTDMLPVEIDMILRAFFIAIFALLSVIYDYPPQLWTFIFFSFFAIVSSNGYVKIRVGRSHPLADPNGYAYEHLIVWCSAGNPRPLKDQIIHHKNEVKTDNRIENLEIKSRYRHSVDHNEQSLTDEQVRELRHAFANGDHTGILAERYKIPIQRAWKIVRGLTRKKAGGPIASEPLRVGKKAGRLLDGREWHEMPEVSR